MWKITLFCNILILSLLWLLSMVAITPAHNMLVQYAEMGVVFPLLTDYAIQVRSFMGIVPLGWTILTVFYGKWVSKQADSKRNEYLASHITVTLVLGLSMLLFFSLAGILPILKISAAQL